MSIQQAYDNWSASYDSDQNLTRDLDQNVTRELLGGRHFRSVLELGCGTGKNTAFLTEISDAVHALDFSERMIERARQKVQAAHVRFSLADLTETWPAENNSHDLVVCNLVLEHIEDLAFVFSEANRVLEGRGQFLLNELHPFRQYEGKKARFESEGTQTEIPAFVHHITDFLNAATKNGLRLVNLHEWWHEQDENKAPRLISFLFEK